MRSVYVLILQAKEQGKAEMEELLTKLQKVIESLFTHCFHSLLRRPTYFGARLPNLLNQKCLHGK